ncbi:hypothetical protein ABPG74_009347 [Tetrahymena malaccensis]
MKTQQKCQKLLSQKIDIFFSNLNGLINYGKTIQKNKYLSNQELYPYADQSTNVQVQIQKLKAFIKENQQYFQSVNFDLKRIYIFLTGKTFLKGLLVSLLMELLIPIGIYMLDELTNYLKDEKYGNKLLFMLYPFGIVISFTLRNILYGQNEWIQCVWQSQNKTILQYLVFRKSLRIKNYAKKNKNSIDLQQDSESDDSSDDEGDNQNTEKNTILNEDIEQLGQLYWGVIQTTGSILIICTTLFQIYLKIGYSFVKGISILIFAFVVNILLGQLFERCFDQMRESKESRISLTKDVIDGIKSIKLFGWEGIFSKKIQKNRSREYKHLFFLRLIEAFLMLFFQSLSQILLYYFIASYIDDGNSFQNSNVFTIIALFGYLSYPLGILPESFRELIKFKVSFKRIQSFLNLSEIENNYQMNDDDNQPSNNQVKAKHFSIKGHTENKKRNSSCNGNVSIVIKRMQFRFFIKESDLKNEETKDNHQKFNSSNQSLSEDTDSSSSLNSKDKQKDVFQLNVNDLEIKKGSLNFVIGKIGSGKTAFLNAILNEIEAQSANQESNKTCHNEKKKINQSSMVINGSIGFVSQNHWLQNDSIKENILFGKENNQEFYEFCVKLCLLNQDFNQFSQGDQKIIYQNGSNLSGGQRQRIALCRAIYQDVDIYLFDDIFSSLDMQVSNQIFKNCIQDYLVKQKNKTVILVTSHYQFLKTNIENSKILIQNGSLTTNQKESKEKNEEQKSNEDENEEERETGRIISRFSEDIGSVDEEIPQLFQQTFEQFFNVIRQIITFFVILITFLQKNKIVTLQELQSNFHGCGFSFQLGVFMLKEYLARIDKQAENLCYEDITQSGYALNNFSLKIKKGEKIAICGRTGSGKTSILNALFRLYQFQKGKIFINNKDIENMSLKELRLSMSVIPQFGFIYNSTLRNNIDPLQEIEDQEIYNLLQSLSDEFQQDDINYQNNFKDLNFEIHESGKNLSNGQKQIINFLRVALRDSEIIFLDEATSNMDPLADRIVHDRLFGLGKDNTLIVITHRLENIDRFDKIIVMDQGAIVEQGTKQELQQIQNGYFNNLLNQK